MLQVGDRVKVNAHGAGRVWLRSNGTNASLQEGSEHVVCAVEVVNSMCLVALDSPQTPIWPEGFFDAVKPDWRIGKRVKAWRKGDVYFGHIGEVLEVLPSGSFGVSDKDGVVVIRFVCRNPSVCNHEWMYCGEVIVSPSRRWVTAG